MWNVVGEAGFEPALPRNTALQAAGPPTAQLAPGAINRDRTGTFRATTWRADHYTMNAAPSEGVEPPLSLCKSGALPLRQPGLNRLGIPGRIRTCDSRFVVWNDLRFTTGTRLAGLTLRRRGSNSDQLVNSQRSCRWTTPECEVPRLAAHRAVAHGEPSWRGADSNRYYPAYETGVLPLDDRAVTLDGSDPSSPA